MGNNGTSSERFAPLAWLEKYRWQALAIILPLVAGFHLFAASVLIRNSNQDPAASDQGAEMWLAETSRDDLVPQRTDGVRHPLWSWLARHTYTPEKLEFFMRGKWLNTAISVVFLCALGVAVTRWLDPLATACLLLLTSLGILLVRGTYFQPEPLYYILSFCAAVLAWRILKGGRWWHFVGFGAVCGLAYLSKPSLLPFLLAFFAAFGVRLLFAVRFREAAWRPGFHVGGICLSMILLGIAVLPLATFSATHFGKPLFNYTKYWMWMDDFDKEAWPFQAKYPGKTQLEQLPKEQTPGASWYFQRHTIGEAFQRLFHGMGQVTLRYFFPEPKVSTGAFFWRVSGKKWEQPLAHRGVYLTMLTLLCVALAVQSGDALKTSLRDHGNLACLVFVLALSGIYVGLYGWYWPIGRGDRFMGSLWIPSVFFLIWLAARLKATARPGRERDIVYFSMYSLVLLSLLLQAVGMAWKFSEGIYLSTRN